MRGMCTAALVAMLWCGSAGAHPGLSKDVDAVTAKLAKHPQDVELRAKRADLYLRLGHPHDALADVRVALEHDPDHEGALLTRALIRADKGRARAARDDLDKVLADGEASSDAWVARARLHTAAGRYVEARADYDAAIAKRAAPDFFLERGRVDETRDAWDDAVSGYREGIGATKGAVVLRLALLGAERHRGHAAAALTEVDLLLDAAPSRVDWILLRAELLSELERPTEATAERLRALALAHTAVARRPTEMSRRALHDTYRALRSTEPLS